MKQKEFEIPVNEKTFKKIFPESDAGDMIANMAISLKGIECSLQAMSEASDIYPDGVQGLAWLLGDQVKKLELIRDAL